ncbi:MAG: translation initiation factor IF-2 [Ruminococcaceae bacterium]|nr:translation initiation factor IF-2 [Oscillospiraceae bacterium]
MLNPKYKISNFAKDLGVKGKVITDILENNGRGVRSTSAVLTPEDFDVVLNELSLANQVSDFNDYMEKKSSIPSLAPVKTAPKKEDVKQEPEKEEVKKEEVKKEEIKKAEPKPEKKTEAKPVIKEEKKAEAKPVKTAEPKVEKKPEVKAEKKEEPKPAAPKSDKKKQPAQARPHMQTVTLPKKHNENDNKTPTQPIDSASRNPKSQVRVVDTRSSSVDLSKYDEKLDRYASDRDYGNSKQKLKKQNQKGQQGKKDKASKEKQAMDKLRRQQEMAKKQVLYVSLPEEITVTELAARLKLKVVEVIKKLMMLGVMATANETVDYDTAFLIADEMGAKITKEANVSIEEQIFDNDEDTESELVSRPPVVCVMGHVDHGKTSLLDAIRHTSVTSGEAGGITQHIGAYTVDIDGNAITFLDTPGHEAFTTMRARGAMATDIAVLVVAADDGIMPQTVEAINHAKAAGVDIIVAINKMDKPTANPDQVKQELTQYELVPEEWGGDVICVPVSAVTGMGIEDLLENILLIAEVKEFKANPNRHAKGVIIEAKLDKGRGPVATVLVQNGTLHAGDVVIAGTSVGHVRAMTDDKGKQVKNAGPSIPVEIIGLSEVPSAGDEFNAVEDEKKARELAEQRRDKAKNEMFKANSAVSLDDLFAAISDGAKTLNIIVKADVRGSAEAVKQSLEKLSNEEVKVKIISTGVGGIIESDVMLAAASNAIIVGFNVRPDKNAIDIAERQGIDIRTYRIIYECIEEITAAMKGMLAPTYKEERLGQAEVRATIRVPNVGTIAGSYVQDGKILRSAQIRVVRDGVIIFEDKISSLRRFKDDVKEVASGYECGIGLDKFNDIKEGDILEAFRMVEVER